MSARTVRLSRTDIRQAHDRTTGAITLKYVGRSLRFYDRLYGYPEGVFFTVVLADVPLPDTLVTLASAVGVSLEGLPLAGELRRGVADLLASEAMLEAPEYLAMCADPRAVWADADVREMERKNLAAENRVAELSRLVETALRQRIPQRHVELPPVRTYAPMAPAGFIDRFPRPSRTERAPEPEVVEEVVEETSEHVETSDATASRVRAAVATARREELPQRLPGGARRALSRLPAGLYISHGDVLEKEADLCVAMMNGQEAGKRSGEVALIDWDGEWPVVARRYGSHGRIVYRVEDALRRHGITIGEAA